MNILVIQNRMGIGDMVIFLPFIQAIADKYNSPVTLLVKESTKVEAYTKNLKYIDIAIMFLSCFIFARTFSIIFNGLSYSLFIPIALIPEYIGLPILIYIRKRVL